MGDSSYSDFNQSFESFVVYVMIQLVKPTLKFVNVLYPYFVINDKSKKPLSLQTQNGINENTLFFKLGPDVCVRE